MGALGHPFLAAMMVAGPAAVTYGGAKLMTNARFINWLANGIRITQTNYSGMAAHLGRLYAVGKAEPDLHQAIQGYLNQMEAMGTQ